ncbi:MAG: ABC transporter permease [Desulfatitalea sp.]|nr:ABC transporter permease [Desulfatitalea sp.]NNK01918.1 ABC transporter permease [Desulfatitalea sp.]
MNFKRLWSMFKSRNHEFFRDRAAFGWNFLFPFLIIAGFAVIFSGDNHKAYKVGIFPCNETDADQIVACLPENLREFKQVRFIGFKNQDRALERLRHYKVDLVVARGEPPLRYWVNQTSPNGDIVEKMLIGGLVENPDRFMLPQATLAGDQVRYIDWLFPGIIGMNIMFSSLYGVGYVIVRYRKNGVLKRLKATPLTAFEYLSAQLLSRMFVLAFSITILWIGCHLIFGFTVQGTYVDLVIMLVAGGMSLTSLGMVVSARGTSEEFTNGLLNFITWPMMFLSEVWFSIEGAPDWVKGIAKAFPLTHLLHGVRKIVTEGAALTEVGVELMVLFGFTLLFLSVGAFLFSWNK